MITKAQIGRFESIEVFDLNFIKVKRDGMYNLINSSTGEYISAEWFKEVTKSNGGGFNVKKANSESRQYASVDVFVSSINVESLLTNSANLSNLDFRQIDVVAPYTINNGITIVAKVKFMSENLLLSKDGQLYYENGTKYEMQKFAISNTDINRLNEKVKLLNKFLRADYNCIRLDSTVSSLKTNNQTVWVFGFNDKYSYIIYGDVFFQKENLQWGGDTIKLRLRMDATSVSNDKLEQVLKHFEFSTYQNKKDTVVWHTKQFKPQDIEKCLEMIETLSKIETYA